MLQQDLATGGLRTREMSERIALADVRCWRVADIRRTTSCAMWAGFQTSLCVCAISAASKTAARAAPIPAIPFPAIS